MAEPTTMSREEDAVVLTRDVEAGIATVRLQDAAGKNALTREVTERLESALRELADDSGVRAIVLAGLPEYFCTGASREILEEALAGSIAPRDLLLPRHVLDVPVPVIAAMEGHAIGGGFALALSADVVVAARESWYSCNFMNYGFTPGMGMTALLGEMLGSAFAAELLYTGRRVKGAELAERRVLNDVLPRGEVMPRAMDIAARIAEKPATSLRALKTVLSSRKRQLFEMARTHEIVMHELTFKRPETARALRDEYGGG